MFFKILRTTLGGAAALLVACGGGGGGGGRSPSLTVSPTSISVTASSEDTFYNDHYIQLTVRNMPEDGLWVAVEFDGDAVDLADFVNPEGQDGEVQVSLYQPSDLLGGEFASTVTINVCRDEACTQHITNSPFELPVTLSVADPADKAPLTDLHLLGHDVVDAEYSDALDAIVMVSATPSPSLHLYDPATQTAQSIALDAAPQSVSVGPDGLSAAVGHDGSITIVDLANIADPIVSPKTVLDLSTDARDIVLAGNGYVHAFPGNANTIRSVEIATNTESPNTGFSIYYNTRARLHHGGAKIYGATNGLTPDDVERYGIAGGVAANEYDSPYHGTYDVCGNLWMQDAGPLIYTACGHAFRASDVSSRDMLHAGDLEIEDENYSGRRIRSLSQSAETHEVVLLDDIATTCDANPPTCTNLRVYDSDYLALAAQYRLLPVKIEGVNYRQRGLFAFHSDGGTKRYLVSKLNPSGYLVSTIDLPAHVPNTAPPAPTVGASTEDGIAAAPLTNFAALPHDVLDAAFSSALTSVVMATSYPSNAVHIRNVNTGADRMIALTKAPVGLSLSPDGLSAAVWHDSLITVVDLTVGGAAPKLLPTVTPGWAVHGGNGYVYVIPSTNARIRSINIATGVETNGSAPVAIGAYSPTRLHPGGMKMYGYDRIRGELTSFPIVLGIADYGAHSPYLPNEYPMCGNQWFSESGAHIYTACGNTFVASNVSSGDMVFVNTLALSDGLRITSLSHSGETQEVALVEYDVSGCSTQASDYETCISHLSLYDSATFAREARYSFSPLTVGGKSFLQQGRFVFHSADGSQRYVISQLLGMPNPNAEFYISRLP